MENPFSKISQIRLTGTSGGAIKSLRGYDKSRHTLPDSVNAATTGFLHKLCATELAEEAETLFQNARAALSYKRAAITLDLAPGLATVVTRDFTWELAYALEPAEPARYTLTRGLQNLRSADLVQLPAFDALFASQFDAVVFDLARGVRVEALVDAIEALDPEPADDVPVLRVDYPSDCSRCELTVPGVAARVECDGASLTLRLPRAGSPAACLAEFEAVRAAFRLSKNSVLGGLLS